MPPWLKVVAWGNPLTYGFDALRALTLVDDISGFGLAADFLLRVGTTGILTIVGDGFGPSPCRSNRYDLSVAGNAFTSRPKESI